MPRVTVVIPTYNERENITRLIPRILDLGPSIDILVVDDSSPDGTADAVGGIAQGNPRVRLVTRAGKLGLGSAYKMGFKLALAQGADMVIQMDADLSHDPQYIPGLIEALGDSDVAIGSRYVKGVNVVNWPMSRLLLSYFANVYTMIITGLPVHDATGGFKCFKRRVLEALDLDAVISEGYCFQIEITFRAWRKGFRILEIPIVFVDRTAGASKMSKRIIWEAIWKVWWFRLEGMLRRI
ncbi:MAG TPA: polyprenol monophosphomannose synthase [bacterium]|nr:polyprenol monophosphomannose synthase [bacterium]